MKIKIVKHEGSIKKIMRKAGYRFDRMSDDGEFSFIRRLGSGDFPRFHVYVDEGADKWSLKLHLDRKRHSYGEETAHSGEYKGSIVKEELGRIESVFDSLAGYGDKNKKTELQNESLDEYGNLIGKTVWAVILLVLITTLIAVYFLAF